MNKNFSCRTCENTRTSTIIQGLRILLNEIESEDWFANGVMVQAADRLARLEASHAELLQVARDVLDWREGRINPIHPRVSMLFDRLRNAIAKAERSEDEPITDDEGDQ